MGMALAVPDIQGGSIMDEKELTNEEVMQELLKLLKNNGMQKESNGVYELCAYVDSLQNKLQDMTEELSEVRLQLKEIKEDTLINNIKKTLSEAADRLENRCNEIKMQLFEVKESMKTKAHEIVNDFKKKGKSALNKVSEFFGVKEKLQKMRDSVKEGIAETDKTIEKIDAFGAGMREANQKIANTFRTFADKPEVDYSKQDKKFSKTEAVKKPWEWQKKVYQSMVLRLDAAIDKVDILSKDIEISRMEKHRTELHTEKDVGNISYMPSMVAEPGEYQYGGDAYEAAVKDGMVSDTVVVNQNKNVEKSR